MFDLYREARQALRQQRQDAWQAFWIVMRAEPWRFATLPISIALTLFLAWALAFEPPPFPGFEWLMALAGGGLLLGAAWLIACARAGWARRQSQENKQ